MPLRTDKLVEFVQSRFRAQANPRKAREMAAYMKTDMPFYGVQKPQRVPIYEEMHRRFAIDSRRDYAAAVEALWSLPHREEKYAALNLAGRFPQYVTMASLPLYRRLIIDGAWWDFVDGIAIDLVGRVLLNQREPMRTKLDAWIEDENMWIRRSALISHIKHKNQTDRRQLFRHCLSCAHEKEFFIRKAIGWTLRQYAWTEPGHVARFLLKHRSRLSPLSFREASKHLEMD